MKEIRNFDKVREKNKLGTIIILVGLPRSGKSTWSKEQGLPIISKDAIRLALHGKRYDAWVEPMVSGLTPLFVDAMFQAGHDIIILDECNVTPSHRNKWRNRGYNIKIKLIDTPIDVCKHRAVITGQEDLIPIIDSMYTDLDISDITKEDLYE